ncbi:MAG: hypothetical protein NZ480_08700 [Bdellovibrionaceae bacterium]|nr:hypothetical protein [Pseudobdellovibrionaceae bacterium]MDW8189594.1 hypothetical protein [Pseudobdellovibrionaceae bacterium]
MILVLIQSWLTVAFGQIPPPPAIEGCGGRGQLTLSNYVFLAPSSQLQKSLIGLPQGQILGLCEGYDGVAGIEVELRYPHPLEQRSGPWLQRLEWVQQIGTWEGAIGVMWDPWILWNHEHWQKHLVDVSLRHFSWRLGWIPPSESGIGIVRPLSDGEVGFRITQGVDFKPLFNKDFVCWMNFTYHQLSVLLYSRLGFYEMINEHSNHRHRYGASLAIDLGPNPVRWGVSYLHHQSGADGVKFFNLNLPANAVPFSYHFDTYGWEGGVLEGGLWDWWVTYRLPFGEFFFRGEEGYVVKNVGDAWFQSLGMGYQWKHNRSGTWSIYLLDMELGKSFKLMSHMWLGLVWQMHFFDGFLIW